MHLRFPIVATVVAVAAAAAGLRALKPAVPAPPLSPQPASTVLPVAEHGQLERASHPVRSIVVYVAGEVSRTGVYTVGPNARGADALRAAGGALPDADLVAVNLAARLGDGDELAVPAKGAAQCHASRSRSKPASARSERAHRGGKRRHRRPPAATADPGDGTNAEAPLEAVDLNTASSEDLEALPGIGRALAERIVTVRDQTGPFASADDLLDVGGMTQSKLDAIAPYITLH